MIRKIFQTYGNQSDSRKFYISTCNRISNRMFRQIVYFPYYRGIPLQCVFNGIKKFPRARIVAPFNSHGRMIGREIVHAGKRKVSPASFLPSIVDQRSGKLIIVHEGASRRLLVTACPASSRRLEDPLLSFPLSLPLS